MPAYVDIDAHGRVIPAADDARHALANRAGRFALLPSAPDLLLLRRTPAAGGSSGTPRCVLAGDLSSFPIADFIAFVHHARLSGLLTVASAGVDRAVSFRDGEVRGARSDAPGERIGEVALRLGLVTRDQLEDAARGGRLLGRTLVEKGYLSSADLWKCFHEQVAAVLHALLLARDGVFFLVDPGEVEPPGAPMSVDTQSLLMDGIRRIDEMSLFASRIPGPDAWVRRREPVNPVTLQPVEQRVLAAIGGQRRVGDVAREARIAEFEAIKVLYHLAEAGYVEAVAAPGATAPADGTDPASLAEASNELFRLVSAAAAQAGGAAAHVDGVRTFLADPQSRFAPLWRTVALAPDGAIDADAVLGNLAALRGAALARVEPTGDAKRYLAAGLRELLFFHLFQAGERLPRAEGDALAAEVKRRLEALGQLR